MCDLYVEQASITELPGAGKEVWLKTGTLCPPRQFSIVLPTGTRRVEREMTVITDPPPFSPWAKEGNTVDPF